MCNKGITVLPATHTRTISAFTPQLQGITALWLVLIASTHEGIASSYLPSCEASPPYGQYQVVLLGEWRQKHMGVSNLQ